MIFCKSGGCSAKLGPKVLSKVLSKLPKFEDENLLVNDIKGVVQEANDFLDGEINLLTNSTLLIMSKRSVLTSSLRLFNSSSVS